MTINNPLKRNLYRGKVGQVPGTVYYTGFKTDKRLLVEVFDYSSDDIKQSQFSEIDQILAYSKQGDVMWMNWGGLNNTEALQKFGEQHKIHPLVLEDVVNVTQRPKLEEFENYLFLVIKMLYYKGQELVVEQISFILTKDYVLTFQEDEGDVLDGVRERLIHTKGRVRFLDADYLMYALFDDIVDHYFNVLETLGDRIESLENILFEGKDYRDKEIVQSIQDLKKEVLRVRRAIAPLRDLVSKIEKLDSRLIRSKSKLYFRDLYDHVIQVSDQIDMYREMIWSLMDMHMTTISNKMNQVMKVLTIIATIFIPLSFFAGLYGMNFEYMPELQLKYGYFYLLGFMVFLVILMFVYFRKKKWL